MSAWGLTKHYRRIQQPGAVTGIRLREVGGGVGVGAHKRNWQNVKQRRKASAVWRFFMR